MTAVLPGLTLTQVFAGFAASAVDTVSSQANAVREATGLRLAMDTRATVEPANGIPTARDRRTPGDALDLLRRQLQDRNAKLFDVARHIVESVQK